MSLAAMPHDLLGLMSRAIQFGPSTLRAITIPFWLTIVTTLPGGSSLTRSVLEMLQDGAGHQDGAQSAGPILDRTRDADDQLLALAVMTSPMTRR